MILSLAAHYSSLDDALAALKVAVAEVNHLDQVEGVVTDEEYDGIMEVSREIAGLDIHDNVRTATGRTIIANRKRISKYFH